MKKTGVVLLVVLCLAQVSLAGSLLEAMNAQILKQAAPQYQLQASSTCKPASVLLTSTFQEDSKGREVCCEERADSSTKRISPTMRLLHNRKKLIKPMENWKRMKWVTLLVAANQQTTRRNLVLPFS